ncbi:MAG: hypothetical protein ACJ75G_04935 [Gaiellaceae bacterium]
MSSELERQLEGMLAAAPEPEPGAGEEALARALSALRPVAPGHRGLRTAALAFAAGVVLLAIAAGSLAAAGSLHVSFGAKKAKPRHPVAPRLLRLPSGAAGVAAVVDGRLSVVTSRGFRLQGLPVSTAALSPHALFVAAGIGRSLVAIRPSGQQAWTRPAGGAVVAIAWAPDGLRIAYVVHAGRRFVLHVIYGNGIHDTTIDRSVRPVRPSWRADSLAFAYVGAGGKAIVYDLGHESRSVVGAPGPVTRLAFALQGQSLLLATPDSATLRGKTLARGQVVAVGWFHSRPSVALETRRKVTLVRTLGGGSRPAQGFFVPGRVVAFARGLVVTRTPDKILAGWREKTVSTLLGVTPRASVEDLAIR